MKNILNLTLTGLLSLHCAAQDHVFDWARNYGNALPSVGLSVTADQWNDPIVTGQFQGTVDFDAGPGVVELTSNGGADVFVQKLDRNGDLLWARSFGGPLFDYGWSVTTDQVGNVLVTGSFQGTVDFDPGPGTLNITAVSLLDMFIIKLDAMGNLIWIKTIGGPQSETGVSIATNSNDDILIVGEFADTVDFDPNAGVHNLTSNGPNTDVFILHLDSDGDLIWARSFGGTDTDEARTVVVDANDDLYLLGNYRGTIDLDPGIGTAINVSAGNTDVFVQKFDAGGNLIWGTSFGGTGLDQGLDLDLDHLGNVYTTGYFLETTDLDPGTSVQNHTATGGDCNIFIQKLDNSGQFVWGRVIASSTGGEQPRSIAVSNSGNVFVTGYVGGTVDFDPGNGVHEVVSNPSWDIFILNLDADGNFGWAESFGSVYPDHPRSITLDKDQNILLTGGFQDTVDFDYGPDAHELIAHSYDHFLLKLRPYSLTTDVLDSSTGNTIKLYPNPSDGRLTIDLGTPYSTVWAEVRNVQGQLVKTAQASGMDRFSIEMNDAPPGMYYLTLNTGNRTSVLQLIITR